MAPHSRHRKPRSALASRGGQTATGATIAALATVTVMAQASHADPQPSIADVQKQVDELNHQSEAATQNYDQAQERTAGLQKQVNKLEDKLAGKTAAMQSTQDAIGRLAVAQYQSGGVSEVMKLALAKDPTQYLSGMDLIKQVSQNQTDTLKQYVHDRAQVQQSATAANSKLAELQKEQAKAAAAKRSVLAKLKQSQDLLKHLTAQQKAKLAAEQKAKEEAAAKQAAKIAAAAAKKAKEQQSSGSGSSGSSSGSSGGSSSGSSANAAQITAKALAFAKAQLGEPYVFGSNGPNSWDCSSLMQASYRAAGVSIPRTTFEQVKIGHRVSLSDIKVGDLIFYYSDISHVAMYIGNGKMIQAPHTGAYVDEGPITEMPIYGVVRVVG
ncbi:hypothetical protein BIV57_22460 [Mangrovactinospora gilvigrisea]|uniref:NlpC/P60 domain-containing protein n=1 Tax=Mangrovactinospora gilvigrisea TaxID=1428644 RepID=A0A1J7C124_9ACTN|nr:C40 family peptidase [Mangrovactinospora gilvigrisea]OIV35268.1 hypothetical protein BIV57_22460 [Mangrovactinospora gilvigrisea]